MQPWNYEPSRVGSHYTAPLLAATAIAAAFGVRGRRALSVAMVPCALLVTLFLNDTVLRVGRWPYVVDSNAYASAVALRDRAKPRCSHDATKACGRSPRSTRSVRLDPRPDPSFRNCPAYDRDARAFFASLDGHAPAHLCGGVPVAP